MRIVLTVAGGILSCPYCHDALSGTLRTCDRCHTSYHEECSRLAGRCALLGCSGALGSLAAAETRFALVLIPPGNPTDMQEADLMKAIGFTQWDAHQKLYARVPHIVGYFPRERVEHVLQSLEASQLEAYALEASALWSAPFLARRVARDGTRLLAWNVANQQRSIDLGQPRFIVFGRMSTTTEKAYLDHESRSKTRPSQTRPFKMTRTHETGNVRFAHVWQPDESTPIAFELNQFRDFAFLGEGVRPSAFENFQALGALLAQGQASDSSLDAVVLPRRFALGTSRLIAHARAPWLAGGARA
jgi:hypothetical protein